MPTHPILNSIVEDGSIPTFDMGYLPPFIGTPTASSNVSPYRTTPHQLIKRYATSVDRINILTGLFNYRLKLYNLGFQSGFQWINGSFSEEIEKLEHRPPGDVDIVTFYYFPKSCKSVQDLKAITNNNLDLFDENIAKQTYKCHPFFVLINSTNFEYTIDATKYYYALFSHKKITAKWKGILRLELGTQQQDLNVIDILNIIRASI